MNAFKWTQRNNSIPSTRLQESWRARRTSRNASRPSQTMATEWEKPSWRMCSRESVGKGKARLETGQTCYLSSSQTVMSSAMISLSMNCVTWFLLLSKRRSIRRRTLSFILPSLAKPLTKSETNLRKWLLRSQMLLKRVQTKLISWAKRWHLRLPLT